MKEAPLQLRGDLPIVSIVGRELRRDPRYNVVIGADLILADDRVISSSTTNISARGAFVATDTSPPLRELLKARFVLPPHQTAVILQCIAVHVVPPKTEGRTPGVGLQLYQVSGVEGTRWLQFVRWIRGEHASSIEKRVSFVERPAPVQPKRTGPVTHVRLSFRTVAELRSLYEAAAAGKGLLVPLADAVPAGTVLEVTLVHPANRTQFSLYGTVHSNVARGNFKGVAVTLEQLQPERLAELTEFVNANPSITIDVTGSIRQLAQH